MNCRIYVSYQLFVLIQSIFLFHNTVGGMMKDDVSSVEMLKEHAKTIGGVLGAE